MPSEYIEDEFDKALSTLTYTAVQNASNQTDRSLQQQDHFLGVSNLGHCRQYAKLMTEQTPISDPRDKNAAFVGTLVGEGIEAQLAKEHPGWLFQQELFIEFPKSAAEIPGHNDIIVPSDVGISVEEFLKRAEDEYDGPLELVQGVYDIKTKAELDTIRFYGWEDQRRFQLHSYAKGGIDAGLLDPEKPIRLGNVFFDRSGRTDKCWSMGMWYDPAVIEEIDDWISDVQYAVIHQEDASRDKPREWCANWCEYFTVCRGNESDAEGLIEAPDAIAAVATYARGAELVREGERMKDNAREVASKYVGSTGEYVIRPVIVEPTFIEGYMRRGYTKLDIRKVPKPKGTKAKK